MEKFSVVVHARDSRAGWQGAETGSSPELDDQPTQLISELWAQWDTLSNQEPLKESTHGWPLTFIQICTRSQNHTQHIHNLKQQTNRFLCHPCCHMVQNAHQLALDQGQTLCICHYPRRHYDGRGAVYVHKQCCVPPGVPTQTPVLWLRLDDS